MNILVVFGGKSSEHEVSCLSAASVLRNIKEHTVSQIGITKDGKWYQTFATADEIENGNWVLRKDNCEVSINMTGHFFESRNGRIVADVVFPVLHGKNGEDGSIQGLFEMMEIPYIGSDILGSALCMNKAYTNMAFDANNIAHTPWFKIEHFEFKQDPDKVLRKAGELTYPVFVKPANAGSSVGVSKCYRPEQLGESLAKAFIHDSTVIIEKSVENAMEIEVAVMGNNHPQASVTGIIHSANDFYDYDAKYENSNSTTSIPSGLSSERELEVREIAVKAYTACHCKGLARVDFLVNDTVYLNEINTIPGFTSISMFPKLWEASGINYSDIIDRLIALALENSND